MKKILKKAVSSLIAMAMAASSFAATVIPAAAAEIVAGDKNLTSADIQLYYHQGEIAKANDTDSLASVLTVGEAFTNNDATNNVTRIMDGNTDAQVVVGTSSNPKSYLIIDLGENHRVVTEIKMTNITNGAVLSLTNTIATDAGSTITLDYSIRGNAGKMYQSGDLGITYQTAHHL